MRWHVDRKVAIQEHFLPHRKVTQDDSSTHLEFKGIISYTNYAHMHCPNQKRLPASSQKQYGSPNKNKPNAQTELRLHGDVVSDFKLLIVIFVACHRLNTLELTAKCFPSNAAKQRRQSFQLVPTPTTTISIAVDAPMVQNTI